MATITANTASALEFVAQAADSNSSARPSFASRFFAALVESRQRRAEIEIRRVKALLEDTRPAADYALLPFAGE